MRTVNAEWTSRRDVIERFRCSLRTVSNLEAAAEAGETALRLDFGDINWIDLVYATPLATAIQRLSAAGVEVDIRYPNDSGVANYVRTIEFPGGVTEPTHANKTYLPLIRLNTADDPSAVDVAGSTIRRLIKGLLGASGRVINGIYLPIGEVLDNVDQHSRCDHGFASVQHFPNGNRIDLCIVDDGITIPGNYEHHGIDFDSDADAVRRALTEGLSTKIERDARGRRRGTGLRTTAKTICEGLNGKLLLASRNGTILQDDSITVVDDLYWDGTVIFARLNVPSEEFEYTKYIVS